MIHVRYNRRVHSVGEAVQLYRFPTCDVCVSEYKGRTNILIFHHAPDPENPEVNELLLTDEDCVWLWSMGVGTGE